jgi:maltose alpha-D-glucosyltransferase/alpha-amylase
LPHHPLWYREAIIYELHVRAFADSNADGIGDFGGLTGKLDYLHDLGVTALWLLPFYPSPLRDGGYDIADYTGINPAYGTLRDFQRFLREAHRRGLRIITELVLNHTSSDHEWFQRARRAPPGSRWRNFYVWSDTPERYADARIIFKDFESSNWSWDPIAKAYYWHRFYSHQPDLNYDNPEVHAAVFRAVDFWLDLGVDGLRLDAVPYLFEREGTNCENLPETHVLLRKLRAHVDAKYRDRMLLAEANQWPEDAAAYFGAGDECHMSFHFPLMPRMFMAVQQEDRFPIVDILRQTPAIAETCQWATFLRNHDELTLEMVTDEDRDYMYRVYAEDPNARINLGIRHRLAPLLKTRRKVELMKGLLCSLPGTPVLYYGDEIGMGDNIYLGDRDGVRTPMQWSADRNAGFSAANPQKLYLPVIIDPEYHYEAINVQAQQHNPSSLLWWTKRLIALRKQHPVFGTGSLEFVTADNPKILAFVRTAGDDRVLVVANLSRFAQFAELELSNQDGYVPVEMFGRTRFPAIGPRPYFLSLGPHSFYWFALERARAAEVDRTGRELPVLEASGSWTSVAEGAARARLAAVLGEYTRVCRWFRGKARTCKAVSIADVVTLPIGEPALLVLLRLDYVEGDPEIYVIPVGHRVGTAAAEIERTLPQAAIARVRGVGEGAGLLVDALATGELAPEIVRAARRRRVVATKSGQLAFARLRALRDVLPDDVEPAAGKPPEADQSNTTVLVDDRLLVKLYRQLEPGPNPEFEIGAFLTEYAGARCTPRVLGCVTYRPEAGEPATIATIHEYVANEGDAWRVALAALERYYERALTGTGADLADAASPPLPPVSWIERTRVDPPATLGEHLGGYPSLARLLGRRTAELHLVLARGHKDPAFAPEPLTMLHQQSLYQRAHGRLLRTLELVRKAQPKLPPPTRELVQRILGLERTIDAALREIGARKLVGQRIRCHGDLHLGQVLYTGDDFRIIDFEGEPARPLSERRYKGSPLRDIAGMLRSFHYASQSALRGGRVRQEDMPALAPWAQAWTAWVGAAYLQAYLGAVGPAAFLPPADADRELLLRFYLYEKCIYELGYELANRPDWLEIPLFGLFDLAGSPPVPAERPPTD